MAEIIGVYVILVIGACLQCVIGFGLGLLCAPLVFLLMPELIPGPMMLHALFLTLILSFRHRGNINYKQTSFSILGGTIGIAIAGFIMTWIDPVQYQMLFGGLILLAVVLSIVGYIPRVNNYSCLLASSLAGFMGTTTAAGGTPMGLLYQSEERAQIKANLSIFFVYINLFGFMALWIAGSASMVDVHLFIQYFPAIVIGWILSHFINRNIQERLIRTIILLVATFSGSFLLVFSG